MKKSRRNFIKNITYSTFGICSIPKIIANQTYNIQIKENAAYKKIDKQPFFNMCGYRAPKMETVKVGFVGIGNRGYSNLKDMTYLEGVEIKAICDIVQFRIDEAQQLLLKQKLPKAKVYTGNEDSWKELCENADIDLVSIAVPRGPLHAAISIYAMKCGKHVAVEVPAITTIEEAWDLVETSEKTKRHCMMMENCCYDFFELLTLNMVRQGFFGDLIHADAGYIHYQYPNGYGIKPRDENMWRLKEMQHHKGNLYPTHGLGPVSQAMNINRGDKYSYMVSMSSNDFTTGKAISELASKDDFFKPFDTNSFNGNMNTSIIRTEKGKTIMLQYDITSPRVYSRIHMLSGTKAAAIKYPLQHISVGDRWLDEDEMNEISEKYMPEIVKRIGNMAKQVGGHGGMDFLMSWRLIDCLRNGLPLDQDVYDAASWSVIRPLSEWSVAHKSNSIEIPDFTRGKWEINPELDLSQKEGGTTTVRKTLLQ